MGEELFCKESKSQGEGENAGVSAYVSSCCVLKFLRAVIDMSLNTEWSYTSQVGDSK